MNLHTWMIELRHVAMEEFDFTPEAAASLDDESWRESFEAGMTPSEALREDHSYGE